MSAMKTQVGILLRNKLLVLQKRSPGFALCSLLATCCCSCFGFGISSLLLVSANLFSNDGLGRQINTYSSQVNIYEPLSSVFDSTFDMGPDVVDNEASSCKCGSLFLEGGPQADAFQSLINAKAASLTSARNVSCAQLSQGQCDGYQDQGYQILTQYCQWDSLSRVCRQKDLHCPTPFKIAKSCEESDLGTACACVSWQGDGRNDFKIRTNMSDKNSFQCPRHFQLGKPVRMAPWQLPDCGHEPITAKLMQAKRCAANAVDTDCAKMGGLMYNSANDYVFPTLQMLLSDFATQATEDTSFPDAVLFFSAPILGSQSFTTIFAKLGASIWSLFIILGLLPTAVFVGSGIVEEREAKLKGGLFSMGTSRTAYYSHWFLWMCVMAIGNMVFIALTAHVWTWVDPKKAAGFVDGFAPSLFVATFLLSLAATGVLFVMSTFFSNALFAGLTSIVCIIPMIFVPTSGFGKLNPFAVFSEYMVTLSLKAVGATDSVWGPVAWLCLDVLLIHLLWLYLDVVIPAHASPAYAPWFLCNPSWWLPSLMEKSEKAKKANVEDGQVGEVEFAMAPGASSNAPLRTAGGGRRSVDEEISMTGRLSLIEPITEQQKAASLKDDVVKITELCVYFRGSLQSGDIVRAVDGASMTMFKSETFCLLGHNGAGKSTTMNVLTGLVGKTSGEVKVLSFKVPEQQTQVRTIMGFCPQHSVLWNTMTVSEHIILFASLAGREVSQRDIEALIAGVGLWNDQDGQKLSMMLSGGMKRKLSVGIAFAGDPQLVILDEPTSGMDPSSRCGLWDFLKMRVPGRILMFTTHFMDEAEALGDRIAIMRSGAVQTCGSAQFLKQKFDVGYTLSIVLEQTSAKHREWVRQELLKNLLAEGETAHIGMAGVGKEILVSIPIALESRLPELLKFLNFSRQVFGLINFGISMTSLEEVFLKVASGDYASFEQKREADRLFKENTETKEAQNAVFVLPNPGGSAFQQFVALLIRRIHNMRRDYTACFCTFLCPILGLLLACAWASTLTTRGALTVPPPSTKMVLDDLKVFRPEKQYEISDTDLKEVKFDNKMHWKKIDQRASNLGPYASRAWGYRDTSLGNATYLERYLSQCMSRNHQTKRVECEARLVATLDALGNDMFANNGYDIGVLDIEIDSKFKIVAVNNSVVAHAVPLGMLEMMGKDGPSDLTITNHAYPLTSAERASLRIRENWSEIRALALLTAMANLCIGMIPIVVMRFVIMERENEVKHQLLISGGSVRMYWLSNFFYDCLVGLPAVGAFYWFLHIYNFEALIAFASATAWILLLFVPAGIALSYVLAAVFTSPGMAFGCVMCCNMICVWGCVGTFLLTSIAVPALNSLSAYEVLLKDPAFLPDAPANDPWEIVKAFKRYDCETIKASLGEGNVLARACPYSYYASWGNTVSIALGWPLPSFHMLDSLLRVVFRSVALFQIPVLLADPTEGVFDRAVKYAQGFTGTCWTPEGYKTEFENYDPNNCEALKANYKKNPCKKGLISGVLGALAATGQLETLIGNLKYKADTTKNTMVNFFKNVLIQVNALSSGNLTASLAEEYSEQSMEQLFDNLNLNPLSQDTLGEILIEFFNLLTAFFAGKVYGTDYLSPQFQALGCLLGAGMGEESLITVLNVYLEKASDTYLQITLGQMRKPEFAELLDKALPDVMLSSGGTCEIGPPLGPFPIPLVGLTAGPARFILPCGLGIGGLPGLEVLEEILEVLFRIFTIGDSLVRMICIALLAPILLLLFEELNDNSRLSQKFARKGLIPDDYVRLEDEAVAQEKTRVGEVDPRKQVIYVKGLRKVFRGWCGKRDIHAVRGVSWSSDQGMVFGLLGVNGAGKTTSFKMMCGIIPPTEGDVRILGIDVVNDKSRARKFIGYCPQFDALIDNLSVQEHLYMYGRMKGLIGEDLDLAVSEKIAELQLAEYALRLAGNLSGGNKRKLSTAMAIIGEPPVVFLDEPSTGMDPFARRFMWGVVQDMADKRQQSVVVITTHSMEEADALCGKLAIQVDGQLRCFGTSQEIKSKYGIGYELKIKFSPHSEDSLTSMTVPFLESGTEFEGLHQELSSSVVLRTLRAQGASDQKLADLTSVMLRTLTAQGASDQKLADLTRGIGNENKFPASLIAPWLLDYPRVEALTHWLSGRYGEAIRLELLLPTIRFRLPAMEETLLPQLLEDIQNKRNEFGFAQYSCEQASLEQIFNRFAMDQESLGGAGPVEV